MMPLFVEEEVVPLIDLQVDLVARSKGIAQLARDTGLGRENLYKSLSADGNPELATILQVVSAFGLRLHAIPKNDSKVA